MARIITLVLVSLASIATAAAQTPFVAPNVDTRFLEPAGEQPIAYSISIPDNYVASKAVPLVLALHFAGDPEGAGRAVLEMLVAQGLSELGAVIVAPDSKGGGWSSPANEHAVNLLLEDVLKNFNIDREKIVVTGYSMGGTGAWYYGMKYPERFSAVIPIAGQPPQSIAQWRLPVLAIHSRDDEVVPIAPTLRYIAELKKNGVHADLIELSGIRHHQTYRFVDGLKSAVPWLQELWK
jgi:predicted peptidase